MEGIPADGEPRDDALAMGLTAGTGEATSHDGASAAAAESVGEGGWSTNPSGISGSLTDIRVGGGGSDETDAMHGSAEASYLGQQLHAALLKASALEEQCSSLVQQNLDLQIFVAQQEEKLLVSSEIMRRMQALSQTLATIRCALGLQQPCGW
jgi:hypothetical protein